ncbi:MAG: SIMPL domain-containing protein [Asticcacaulis sp.]
MKTFATLTAIIAATAIAASPVMADTPITPGATTLSLSVEGEAAATPDMATISFGVQTQARTAAEAMRSNNVRMNAVMAALKAAGIAAKDIQTSSLNLSPQYTYGNNVPPVLNGYQAQDQVSVRVNDLGQTGAVIDSVVKAGINQIDSINFGLKDESAALDTARRNAIATLSQRAGLYAGASGMHLTRLVSLQEGAPQSAGPRPVFAMAKMASADTSTPVSEGELHLSVTVSATYEMAK